MEIKHIAFKKELGEELKNYLIEDSSDVHDMMQIMFALNKTLADLHIEALKFFTTNREYKHNEDRCLIYRQCLNCAGLSGRDLIFMYSDAQQKALEEIRKTNYPDFETFSNICEKDAEGKLSVKEIIAKYE